MLTQSILNNLLNLVHCILNTMDHILFHFVIWIDCTQTKKKRKGYKDKDYYLYIQKLNIPNLKHKRLNSTKVVKYNSNTDQHLFQNTLSIHNYILSFFLKYLFCIYLSSNEEKKMMMKKNLDIYLKWGLKNNQLDIHSNILYSIKNFDLNIPNNLLMLVHYILNMLNHILYFYLFIFSFEKK